VKKWTLQSRGAKSSREACIQKKLGKKRGEKRVKRHALADKEDSERVDKHTANLDWGYEARKE